MQQEIDWERYPQVANKIQAKAWIQMQAHLDRAPNTIDVYARGLEDYFHFCEQNGIQWEGATSEHIALYVHDLATRPNPHGAKLRGHSELVGLANATMHQRLTVVRLLYQYMIEEGLRLTNPVGKGRYVRSNGFGGQRERSLLPHYHKLPWLPTDEQWQSLLQATKTEILRNRVMFAFAYDAALRREEICALTTQDIDPSLRLIRIRAETTKNLQERLVPYTEATSILYATYLRERRSLSQSRGPLFLSESQRNRAQPISIWTWSKVVQGIAERAGVPEFTTHTLRHLCLTDLARANWDIHEIAIFAGHRSIESTMVYIHLSGRDLKAKLERGMASIHAWRVKMMSEELR